MFYWKIVVYPNIRFTTSLTEMAQNFNTNRNYNRASCCWNCRAPGHLSSNCPHEKRLFCSYCLKDGTTTRNCGCRPARLVTKRLTPHTPEDWKNYPECSKAARAFETPLWIGVGNESFRTFIHTSQVQTRVGWLVATKSSLCYGTRREFVRQEDGIISESLIPFRFQNTVRTIRCRINDEPSDQIFFGTDALNCFGFQMIFHSHQCINWLGCSDFDHQSVFDLPIIRQVEATKFPPRTPLVSRNPIDLSLDYEDQPVDESTMKIPPMLPEEPKPSWGELALLDDSDEVDEAVTNRVLGLRDSEIDEYLNLDIDDMEMDKLE